MSKPRQKFNYPCPACFTVNQVKLYTKPTAITPAIAHLVCERCDCKFVCKVEKKSNLSNGQVLITPKLTYISPDGKRFIRAQEEARKQKEAEAAIQKTVGPGAHL